MIFVSDVMRDAPTVYKTPLQKQVYRTLNQLQISFERVHTDEVITMEDCLDINERLNMEMVKTLFLCNSKKTSFYLYITTATKPFSAKDFSRSLGISRVSFAPAEQMESILGTKVGAATVFGVLKDSENLVEVVFDKDIIQKESFGCSDGTTTGYIKVPTNLIVNEFLSYTNHVPKVIDM